MCFLYELFFKEHRAFKHFYFTCNIVCIKKDRHAICVYFMKMLTTYFAHKEKHSFSKQKIHFGEVYIS